MNVMREIEKINMRELELGISETGSWHYDYRHSAYIFIGGLDYELTEGDLLVAFSQFGEIVDLHLVRDKTTGRSMGYAFLAYEDQRSTILAVDNMNGWKLCGKFLRVDHADKFRRPKSDKPQASGEDAKYQTFAPEDDPDYDTRRKQIWDYERYGTLGQKPSSTTSAAAAASSSSAQLDVGQLPPSLTSGAAEPAWVSGSHIPSSVLSTDTPLEKSKDRRHADRVFQMMEEKRKQRALVAQQEAAAAATQKGDRRR